MLPPLSLQTVAAAVMHTHWTLPPYTPTCILAALVASQSVPELACARLRLCVLCIA